MAPPKKKSTTRGKSGATASRTSKSGTRKKSSKKSGATGKPIAIAFIMGLILASAFFILMKPEPPQGTKSVQSVSKTEKGVISKGSLPKVPADKAKKAAKKADAGKEERRKKPSAQGKTAKSEVKAKTALVKETAAKSAGTSSLAAPLKASTPVAGKSGVEDKKASGQQDSSKPPEQKQAEVKKENRTLAAALVDLKSLPYEESLSAHIQDQVRQVDYALIQAARLKKLAAGAMRQARMEDRAKGKEHYHFQVIEVLPGASAEVYITSVKECLSAWAEKAKLSKSDKKNQWVISVNGVQTHVLKLYPGKKVFPPLPGTGVKPEPHEKQGLGKARVRQPGQPAKLVIVMDDLGGSSKVLQGLIKLNFPVTCAFWPHGAHTKAGARAAHAAGLEILVHQPMEPMGYPEVKPGPNVLLVGMSDKDIREAVKKSLAAVPHAAGLNNHMGSRFTQHGREVDAVLYVLRDYGFFMLDSVTHGRSVFLSQARKLGIRHYRRNVFLDVEASKASVLAQLRQAERIALLTGQAVAIGHPLPQTLSALREWQKTRNKEVTIVRLRDLEQD